MTAPVSRSGSVINRAYVHSLDPDNTEAGELLAALWPYRIDNLRQADVRARWQSTAGGVLRHYGGGMRPPPKTRQLRRRLGLRQQRLGAVIGDGVVAAGSEIAVGEASPAATSVRASTGRALTRGDCFEARAGRDALAIGAAHAPLARVDGVVARRDLAGRTAVLAVLAGTPGASPSAPALAQAAAGVWEIALARVAVTAAAAPALP